MENGYINGHTDPYQFITNPTPPPRHSPLHLPTHDPFLKKIIWVLGGAALLFIILIIIAIVMGGGKSNTDSLMGLAQTQQELMRVATRGTSEAVQQTTKNIAVTAQMTLQTQQQQTLSLLANNGVKKVGAKQLALKQDASTDQQLTTAKETSTFDIIFLQIMQRELQSYSTAAKQLSSSTSKQTEKDLFGGYYEQAQLIIALIPASTTTTP